jgi:hypothetical protein
MNKKLTALTLALLCTIGAVMASFAITTFASADTADNSTSTQQQTLPVEENPPFSTGMMEQSFGGFRMGPNGHMQRGMFDAAHNNLEVSEEYKATVNSILAADSDVASLISQGFTVTQIHPVVKNVVQADGTVISQATTAIVILQTGTQGHSTVKVDVENAKVTYIDTVIRTIIDKTGN